MIDRRKFLLSTLGAALGLGIPAVGMGKSRYRQRRVEGPVIISTWQHGIAANQEAWEVLSEGRSVLDAVEAGVKVSEADPSVDSVGFGGLPDSSGEVTLDACIMNSEGEAGAVACLKHILHPVSVARLVMEKTEHVMLTGDGALQFALDQGFSKSNLLTPSAREAWRHCWSTCLRLRRGMSTDTPGTYALTSICWPAGWQRRPIGSWSKQRLVA